MEKGTNTDSVQPQKMSIEGPIKIETSEKKTSLIKRKKDKLLECKKSNVHGIENLRYSLHWDYTTNKSGKQQFTFTGKEMGEKFWSPEQKMKLKMGDLVIYKKNGHPNNKYKARIYAKTGLINKIDALKKGIIDELPKIPDEYDIKFIAPPVINGNRITKEKGVKKENIEKIPGYRFFFCYPTDKDKDKYNKYSYKKSKLKKKVQTEMKKGFVKKLPWKVDMIEAKHAGVTKDKLTGKDILSDKLVDQPNSIKFQIGSVELIEVSDPIHLHKGKSNEVHKIRALVHLRLDKVEDGKAVVDAEKAMSVLDCKEHKRRTQEIIEELREESAKAASSFSEYIGDKLTTKYANNFEDIKWYHDKARGEMVEELYEERKKERKEKTEMKKEEKKEKKRDEVKDAKEVIDLAKKEGESKAKQINKEFDDKLKKDEEEFEKARKGDEKLAKGKKKAIEEGLLPPTSSTLEDEDEFVKIDKDEPDLGPAKSERGNPFVVKDPIEEDDDSSDIDSMPSLDGESGDESDGESGDESDGESGDESKKDGIDEKGIDKKGKRRMPGIGGSRKKRKKRKNNTKRVKKR